MDLLPPPATAPAPVGTRPPPAAITVTPTGAPPAAIRPAHPRSLLHVGGERIGGGREPADGHCRHGRRDQAGTAQRGGSNKSDFQRTHWGSFSLSATIKSLT